MKMSQIPIYVINLDRRPDRLAGISEQLATLGLEFERIAALDGKSSMAQIECLKLFKALLSPTESGKLNPPPDQVVTTFRA